MRVWSIKHNLSSFQRDTTKIALDKQALQASLIREATDMALR
jgi:hypothetical protein